jgi:hypothetical protein
MRESEDGIAKNQKTVDALREVFAPLTERLTPEVEPATTYLVSERLSEPASDAQRDK